MTDQIYKVRDPSGNIREIKGPAGATDEEIVAQAKALFATPTTAPKKNPLDVLSLLKGKGYQAAMDYSPRDTIAGGVRGAGSIGATLLTPYDLLAGNTQSIGNPERRTGMDDALKTLGADPTSTQFQTAKLLAEIGGTSGVGGAIAKGVGAIPGASKYIPTLLKAMETGGMSANGAKGAYGVANRVAGGTVTGGATAGLINPEDAKTGAIIGGVGAGVVQGAGNLGVKIGEKATAKFTEAKKKFARRAQLNDTIKQSVEAGYKIPPNMVHPSMGNQVIESVSGKHATSQIASLNNAEVTDKLVRQSLGLADDVPLSVGKLKELRKTAGKAYAEVASLSPQAAADLEALKVARNEAQGWFKAYNRSARPDDLKKAKDFIATSNGLETAMEQHAATAGRPELVPALHNARKAIAKTYTVERALNDATGTVEARVLARMYEKGLPLSDGLDVAGRFASAFPSITKSAQQTGSPASHNLKSFMSVLMGSGGAAGGAALGSPMLAAPLAAAGMAAPFVAPAAARSIMFRSGAQKGLVDAAPKMSNMSQLAGLLDDPELRQLLLRSAPATSSLLQ